VIGRIALAVLLALPIAARADAVADFYKGKTVNVYVGYAAGGGYDQYGRLLAGFIGKHIPGNPAVVVKNMPGAGSATLANFLYNAAPKDGTAFGIFYAGLAFGPLFGGERAEGLKFDAIKFTWLGSLEQFTPIGISWHTSAVKTIEDAKTKELVVGSSGVQSSTAVYARLLNRMIGTRFRLVHGYQGSNDITLAMERGEVAGFIGWCWDCMKADRPQWIAEHKVNVFLQLGLAPNPEMKDVPFVLDLLSSPEQRQVFQLILSELAMARPFAAPPGIPAVRAKALRAAFEATAADPELRSAAARAHRAIMPFTGAEIDALLQEAYALPNGVIAQAAQAMSQ